MSGLAEALAPFDADALALVASVGLVRRARKEGVEAGEADGTFLVGGETVTLDASLIARRGIEAGTGCTCPATGACRHILAAILHAREVRPTPGTGPDAPEVPEAATIPGSGAAPSPAAPGREGPPATGGRSTGNADGDARSGPGGDARGGADGGAPVRSGDGAPDAWDVLAAMEAGTMRRFAGAQWWHALEVGAGTPRRSNGRVTVELHAGPNGGGSRAGPQGADGRGAKEGGSEAGAAPLATVMFVPPAMPAAGPSPPSRQRSASRPPPAPPKDVLAAAMLTAAIVKGADRHRRRMVAAAAIAVRRAAESGWSPETADDAPDAARGAPDAVGGETGVAKGAGSPSKMPANAAPSSAMPGGAVLTGAFIADVLATLERAAADPSGGPATVEDDLRLLATSGRADRAPRLAALLRGGAEALSRARARDVSGSAARTLAILAEAHALATALRADPGNEALTGRLRRDYADAPPFEAWVLGARAWTSPTGARGLTVMLLDEASDRLIEAGEARAGGQDPAFSPEGAYRAPLGKASGGGGPTVEAAMGRLLRFGAPRLAPDPLTGIARLAPSCPADLAPVSEGVPDAAALDAARLARWPISHSRWEALRADLGRRLPLGLAASGTRAPVILLPAAMEVPVLDEMAQLMRWRVRDDGGDALDLAVSLDPRMDRTLVARLSERFARRVAPVPILASAIRAVPGEEGAGGATSEGTMGEGATGGLRIEPVALYLPDRDARRARAGEGGLRRLARFAGLTDDGATGLSPVNLTLDRGVDLERRLAPFDAMRGDPAPDAGPRAHDPHVACAERALRLAEDAARRGRMGLAAPGGPDGAAHPAASLAGRARALGLGTLAAALGALARHPSPPAILRVTWVAGRVLMAAREG